MPIDFQRIRALTFDCYGTLIDWDGGIRAALAAMPSLKGCDMERLVREREEAEHPLLAGEFRQYGEILALSLRSAAASQQRTLAQAEVAGFVASMPHWPAFSDCGPALRRLAMSHVLGIVSNVETKTLQASVKVIGAPFLALITAEAVRSYKPAPKHWEAALTRLHQRREALLHVAGSLYHDIRPASALGIATAWINRRHEPVPDDVDPETVFPDLASLAALVCGPVDVA